MVGSSAAAGAFSPRQALWWFLAAMAGLLAFRVVALAFNRTDLFFDEAQYWFWGERLQLGYFSKPPLIGWIIRAVTDVCGETAFCIRLASPIIHAGTATLVFLAAMRLAGPLAGLWSGLIFATLPGISVSSGIASTDVPLLFFYALALFAFVRFLDREDLPSALLLGVAIGGGLMAKYAMAYFVGCAALYLALSPRRRRLLASPKLAAALAVALAIIAPNLWWNWQNSGVTFSHTAANAKWGGDLFKPGKALEFLAAQFGVFGPVTFAAFLVIVWRWARGTRPISESERMLLLLALPVIAAVTLQAFLSRAHANWAAVAYVPASILVASVMLRDGAVLARRATLAIHLALAGLLAVGTSTAGLLALPPRSDPFARVLGWSEAIHRLEQRIDALAAEGRPVATILADDRAVLAELVYYLRDRPIPVRAWRDGPGFRDHYEMVAALAPGDGEPMLLVHHRKERADIHARFAVVEDLGTVEAPIGAGGGMRTLFLSRLSGWRGPP